MLATRDACAAEGRDAEGGEGARPEREDGRRQSRNFVRFFGRCNGASGPRAHDNPSLASSLAYLRGFATVIGGLTGSTLSLIPSLPAELLPKRIAVLASAALLSPVGVGFVVGPTIAGQISDTAGSYNGAKVLAGVCLGVAALVVAMLDCLAACHSSGPKGPR